MTCAVPPMHRRARSPLTHEHDHHHRKRKRSPSSRIHLPLSAGPISKHGFSTYKPMFALYLDVQKQLVLEDLPDSEMRGRWKSFVGKWNRGELAEGWYDPATLQKAVESATQVLSPARIASRQRESPLYESVQRSNEAHVDSSDDDAIGPSLPNDDGHYVVHAKSSRSGPTIPGLQDLELQRELATEDSILAHGALRNERAVNRKEEKDRLEELVPRADAGSKERMLEKKREKADGNRAFASAKTESGGVAEVSESDLLGDDGGGIEGFKKQRKDLERKKNEREIRREEVQRARAVEREERVKQYKEKEEATMKGLVELARARFG